MEIVALGGAAFERAVRYFASGGRVNYRGIELALSATELVCRVPWAEARESLTDRRALDALTRAKFRVGALLASAPPLAALVGNREPRLVLVGATDDAPALFELQRDRMRRL